MTRRVGEEEGLESTGQEQGRPPRDPRVIKRYANRKLYDTRESRYVTLQQIAKLVRDGEEVAIIDNTTKEDLTRVTLAQIIYEEEKSAAESKRALASVGTLRQLIQQSGEKLMSSLREGPMGKLIPRRDEEPEDAASEPAKEEPRTKEPKRSVLAGPKEVLDELQRMADDRMRGLIQHAITHVQQLQGEVKRLQARIEELEERLVKLGRRGKNGKDSEPSAEGPGDAGA
ncbi:MAG TPA: polyhydroxyalkanoate synthesis regulator DNA-binding domain-containing protein [Sandaracinaceae bacterium]